MDSKDIIQEYFDACGAKSFVHKVKKNTQVMADLKPLLDNGYTISEACYRFINGSPGGCPNGKEKKFKSFVEGFVFCGRAGVCECAKASVSANVAATKALATEEDKKKTNKQRESTNIKRYGVKNAGQTVDAKAAHAAFYEDENNVASALAAYKTTMLDKHGVDNGFKLDKVNDKRENDNPMKDAATVEKAVATRLSNLAENSRSLIELGYQRVKLNLAENHNIELLNEIDDYIGTRTRPSLDFRCISCDYSWSQRYDHANYPECKVCNPSLISYKSKQEVAILDYVQSIYSGSVISGDRRIINPYEVDILVPEKKVAIEYCGLYWHSELSADKKYSYHKTKMDLLSQKGYRLITIFSDEWLDKPEIVKSKISTILGVNTERVFARKTTVKKIERSTAIDFINKYHIQGAPTILPISYGLFDEHGSLISVMSFRKSDESAYDYTLNRFCSSIQVVGGASRLMKAFVSDYKPKAVVSFADLRWSDGNLYNKLDFINEGLVPPMQYYVKDYATRYHKLAFAKSKLVQAGGSECETEWEMLQKQGYDRIWDCGKIRFVWRPK